MDLSNLQSDEFDRTDRAFLVAVTLQGIAMIGVGLGVTGMLMNREMPEAGFAWGALAAWIGALLVVLAVTNKRQAKNRGEQLHGASKDSIDAFRRDCDEIDISMIGQTGSLVGSRIIDELNTIITAQGIVLPVQLKDGKRALMAAKMREMREGGGVYDD